MDEAGIVTRQENDRRGMLLGPSDATCWCHRRVPIHQFLENTFHHASARWASGATALTRTPPRAAFGGAGLRQQLESRSTGALQSHAALSEARDDRGDVDDRAPTWRPLVPKWVA